MRVAQRASGGGAGSCPRLGLARGAGFFCGDVGAAARELGLGLLGCAAAAVWLGQGAGGAGRREEWRAGPRC